MMDVTDEVQIFANNIFSYVFSTQTFFRNEKFIKTLVNDVSKYSILIKRVGNAVRIAQFLLRDYFKCFFHFTFSKESFFLFWSHWVKNRNNVFVKVIDTLAIIAEAFLFYDSYEDSNFCQQSFEDLFMELFVDHLATDFFKYGQWGKLKEVSYKWYRLTFQELNHLIKTYGCNYKYDYGIHATQNIYSSEFIEILKTVCYISYPVHKSFVTDDYQLLHDIAPVIVYLKPVDETLQNSNSLHISQADSLKPPANLQYKSTSDIKNCLESSKLIISNESESNFRHLEENISAKDLTSLKNLFQMEPQAYEKIIQKFKQIIIAENSLSPSSEIELHLVSKRYSNSLREMFEDSFYKSLNKNLHKYFNNDPNKMIGYLNSLSSNVSNCVRDGEVLKVEKFTQTSLDMFYLDSFRTVSCSYPFYFVSMQSETLEMKASKKKPRKYVRRMILKKTTKAFKNKNAINKIIKKARNVKIRADIKENKQKMAD